MRRDLSEVDQFAAGQSGVVNRSQLAAMGVSRHIIARRVAAGAWRELGPRVVVLHRGSLSREQRWWAGVMHAALDLSSPRAPAPRCALSGLTAAEAGGLRGLESNEVHVVVDHGREVGDLLLPDLQVRLHQTRHLLDGETHPLLLPPRLRMPRAVIESASAVALSRPYRARAIVAAAVQQRLVRPADLREFALSRPTLPGRRLLLECCAEAEGGAHSLPEMEYLRALRRTGLPEPTRQRVLQHADGRWYLDNDFQPYLVTVEINGIQHYEQMLRERDDFRRAVLQIGGRIVVDLSTYVVRHHVEAAMVLTAEALIARGYQPDVNAARNLDRYRDALGWTPFHLRAS